MAKIAIIEDDLAIARTYRARLEAGGDEVELAENGKLGLELCQRFKPDVVLIDLMMPEMNGDEMLERLRATPAGKDIKVFILTNVGEQEAPAKLRGLGVSGFIIKVEMTPHDVAELVTRQLGTSTQ